MEEYGSIGDMFTRFMEIFYKVEKEKKTLRYLPKQSVAKVTSIQEAKDLSKLPLKN